MTISKTLLTFAKRIENDDVLNNPQDFLGPNVDQLLHFWNRLDELTEEQRITIGQLYRNFHVYQNLEWCKVVDVGYKAYNEAIRYELAFDITQAVEDVYGYGCNAACYATWEIIGGVENPVFFKMFEDFIENDSQYSKAHKHFSEYLNDPRVLTNPEEYLGDNSQAVLKFWLSLDDLSKDQWDIIKGRYRDFYDNQYSEWRKVIDKALKASEKTIGCKFAYNAAVAAMNVYAAWDVVAYCATQELIGGIKNPVFIPMFANL